jgi:hypothetical protein
MFIVRLVGMCTDWKANKEVVDLLGDQLMVVNFFFYETPMIIF